jgi:large subunit ribosomal protein L23
MSQIILRPVLSEKSYALTTLSNTYVFEVPLNVNRLEVRREIEARFKVTVTKITSLVTKGKSARSLRIGDRSGRRVTGQRKDVKKVYVSLKDGDKIKVFDEPKEDKKTTKAKVAEKVISRRRN